MSRPRPPKFHVLALIFPRPCRACYDEGVSIPSPTPPNLTDKLLLADAGLLDPNFFRSVIYMTQHGEDGAHGFVINHPLERTVDSLLSGEEFELLAEVPVFQGGPVNAERLSFATIGWDPIAEKISFETNLSTEDATEAFLAGKDVRAFVGYAGWSGGQLEKELEQHTWTVHPAVPLLARPDLVEKLWSRILRELGPYYEAVSRTPDHPEHN